MKTVIFLYALASHGFANEPILIRVTAETLANLQKRDPMIRLEKPAENEVTTPRPQNQSIIKESTILHDGRNWTLVPTGAVVFLPESLKPRVNTRPVGTLLPWTAFLTINRAWITTTEVNFDQAAGNEALPEERAEFWAKQDKIVVAVHQAGPISVRVAKAPDNLTKR
jgi:hypothetical protein